MRYISWLILAFVLSGINLEVQSEVVVGDRAFFSMKSLSGLTLRNTQYRGKLLVIHFYESHNPLCTELNSHLKQLEINYKKSDVCFIGVSFDDAAQKTNAMVKEAGFNHPQVCDGLGFLSPMRAQWGVKQLPYSIMIGPKGKVIWTGPTQKVADAIRKQMVLHLHTIPMPHYPHSPLTQAALDKLNKAIHLIKVNADYDGSFKNFAEIHPRTFNEIVVLMLAEEWMTLLNQPQTDKAAIRLIMKDSPDVVNQLKRLQLAAEAMEERHKRAKFFYEEGLGYERRGDPQSGYFLYLECIEAAHDAKLTEDCLKLIRELHKDPRFELRYLKQNQIALRLYNLAREYEEQGNTEKALNYYRQLKRKENKRAWGMMAEKRLEIMNGTDESQVYVSRYP